MNYSRSLLFALSSVAVGAIAIGSMAHAAPTTISVAEVKTMIENTNEKQRPLVLDTRGGYKDYISGHVPTAHHINFDTLRGTDKGVPVQYLPDDITAKLLQRAGVDKNRTHILYAEGSTGDEILSASMVAYVLEKFGVEDVRIMDGGLPEFKKVSALSQKYPNTPMGKLPAKINKSIGVDVKTVLREKSKKDVILVDARPENEYLGKDEIWPRKGHIPGAISFPWRNVMMEDNTHKFKSPEVLKAAFERAGLTPDKQVIVYCGTSREGSLLRFYLKHVAKYPNVRLYEGSWKEYSSMESLPAETEMKKIL